MATEESRPSALMMEAEAPSIEAVATTLLRETRESDFTALKRSDRESLEEEVAFFFNELTTIVLNWISSSQLTAIEQLSAALERAVAIEEPNGRYGIPLHDRLTARLDTLAYVLRAVLRTENLAKYLGQLSGKRRAAWGELLVAFYDADRPVSKSDARAFVKSITDPNTLYNALERLVEMGLLERLKQDNTRVLYALSWTGRLVARAWSELHKTEPDKPISEMSDYWDALLKSLPAEGRPSKPSRWGTSGRPQGEMSENLVMASAR